MLGENSVLLNDLKLTFFKKDLFDSSLNLDDLEAIIYLYFKIKLPQHTMLNAEESIAKVKSYNKFWRTMQPEKMN